MERQPIQVPFGFTPPEQTAKGTLFVYDSFDFASEYDDDSDVDTVPRSAPDEPAASRPQPDGALRGEEMRWLLDWAERQGMARLVLYIPHEETLKRMGFRHPSAMYKREEALRRETSLWRSAVPVHIDVWERKRKKYTPMDTALRKMSETYAAPYFIGLSGSMANRFASYQPFEEWIRKVRLVVADASPSFRPHPLLANASGRWDRLATT